MSLIQSSFPKWLPDNMKPMIEGFRQNPEYQEIIRLIEDKDIMPSIWLALDRKGKIYEFLVGRINDISFWGMADRTPLHAQKKNLLKAEKYLQELVSSIYTSSELMVFFQSCFENALNSVLVSGYYPPSSKTKCNTCGKQVLLWKNNMFTFPALRGMRYSAF